MDVFVDDLVDRVIMDHIDHRNLNEVLALEVGPAPTTEVLVVELWSRLVDEVPLLARRLAARSESSDGRQHDSAARLEKLTVGETEKNSFEYSG